jgi:subtilisin family serine protease
VLIAALSGPALADFIIPPGMTAPPAPRPPLSNYSDEHFLVRLQPGADRQAFARQVRENLGVTPRFHERFDGYASVSFARGARGPALAAGLSALPWVESVRPHLLMHAHSVPNDPFFKNYGDPDMDPDLMDNQYYLFEVNAPQAWELEKGSPDTVIAIIDSGVSVYHEDLADKIVPGWDFVGDNVGWWVGVESEESPGSQDDNPTVWDPAWGQPDDHGYPGFDIFSDDSDRAAWWAANYDPAIGDTVDNNPAIDPYGGIDSGVSHGTVAASMAAAVTDNGMGMAGMAWYPSIMPVRVINAEGWGFGIDAADAIYWAVENGADVLNLSWGFGPMYAISPAEFEPGGEGDLVKQALEWAHTQGVMIIASAGNSDGVVENYGDHEYFGDGISHSGGLDFPANLPQTISVGSTNEARIKSDFSSYADPLLGEILDVVAPGESLETLGMWSGSVWSAYDWWLWGELLMGEPFLPLGEDLYDAGAMGTSFSAPIVSGLAALIKSRYPFLTNDDLREILMVTGQDLGDPGYDPYFGYGLLDAGEAIRYSDVYVSEPVTASLFLAGVAVIGWRARRRRSA